MKSWLEACKTAWALLRDVGFTAYGAWIVYRQVVGTNVSVPLLILGGALMVPAARANFIALLLSVTGQSSTLPPPPGEPPSGNSSRQEAGTGE